jgi:hypothetical protein
MKEQIGWFEYKIRSYATISISFNKYANRHNEREGFTASEIDAMIYSLKEIKKELSKYP